MVRELFAIVYLNFNSLFYFFIDEDFLLTGNEGPEILRRGGLRVILLTI